MLITTRMEQKRLNVWLADGIVSGGVLFLIVFTPLTFGAVHPWSYSLMEATVFLLVMVWMGKLLFLAKSQEPRAKSPQPGAKASDSLPLTPYLMPLTLFIGMILFQLLPVPPSFIKILSPSTYKLYTVSLPGWPEKMPYENLSSFYFYPKANGGHPTPNTQPVLLPTRDEVRNDVPVPHPGSGSSRLTPDASPVTPKTWLPLSIAPSLSRTDILKLVSYGALFFLIIFYPFKLLGCKEGAKNGASKG